METARMDVWDGDDAGVAEEKVAVCIQHILPNPLILSCVCGEILMLSLVGRMALKFCNGLIYLLCFDVLLF